MPGRLRARLAALGLVGAAMVLLPLAQLLRYQNAELQTLMDTREGLDPAAATVEVQRALIAHRDVASLVLNGRQTLEPERLLRQHTVDGDVAALSVALAAGPSVPARREADALRVDWLLLAREITGRSVSAVQSDQAHGLIVEQALQVLDLLSDAAAPQSSRDDAGHTAALLTAAHALPRLAAQIDQLAMPAAGAGPDAAAWQRQLANTEFALARTLSALSRRLDASTAMAARHSREQASLAEARADAATTAASFFAQSRPLTGRSTELPPAARVAAAAARDAQFALGVAARQAAGAVLSGRISALTRQRGLLLTAMALLALTALALTLSLRRRQPLPAAAPSTATDVPAAAPSQGSSAVAGRLLARLRDGDGSGGPTRHAERIEPQPTLPPPQ